MPGVAPEPYEQLKKGVKNLFRRKKKAAKNGRETDEPSAMDDSGEVTAPSADASLGEPASALETQTESVAAGQSAQPSVSFHENTGAAQVTEESSK